MVHFCTLQFPQGLVSNGFHLAKSNLFSELERVVGSFDFVPVKLSPVTPVLVGITLLGAWSFSQQLFLLGSSLPEKKIRKSRTEKLETSSLCSNAEKTYAPNICSPKKQHSYFGEANVQN
jgi:hypothetical protein